MTCWGKKFDPASEPMVVTQATNCICVYNLTHFDCTVKACLLPHIYLEIGLSNTLWKIVHAGNWCFPANCASGKFESWDTLVARILHICQKRECVLNVKAGIWWRFDADLRDQMSVGCLANIESTLHCSRSVKYISSFQSFKKCDFFHLLLSKLLNLSCAVFTFTLNPFGTRWIGSPMLLWKPKYFVSETNSIFFSEEIDLSRAQKSFPKEMLLLQSMAQISSPPNSVTKLDRCLETQAQKAITGVFGTESWWAIIYLNIYNGRWALCL